MIRVLVWNEFHHEKNPKHGASIIYPNGIHQTIADFLQCDDISVKTATQDEEDCGITAELLEKTDVLIWWSHGQRNKVPDEVAKLVQNAVQEGMGAIFLHSAHLSKPFTMLMGSPCTLTWRESGDSELLWVVDPSHPITAGIDRAIRLPNEETYGEPFTIPEPCKTLFIANFSGGEVFRAGCLFERGNGKIFYFQPGHETYPTYHIPEIQAVIKNAVRFLAPTYRAKVTCPKVRHFGDPEGYVIEKK